MTSVIVSSSKKPLLIKDLKPGDTFIFEPNRLCVYTVLKQSCFNLYSHGLNKTANVVNHEGVLYSFLGEEECRKVDIELKVIIKE